MTSVNPIIASALSLYTFWRLTISSRKLSTAGQNFQLNRVWSGDFLSKTLVSADEEPTAGAAADTVSDQVLIRTRTCSTENVAPKLALQVPGSRIASDKAETRNDADIANQAHQSLPDGGQMPPEISLRECERLAIKVIKVLGKRMIDSPADGQTSCETAEEATGLVLAVLESNPDFWRASQNPQFRKLLLETLSFVELIDSAVRVERAIAERATQLLRPLNEAEAAEVAHSLGISEVRFTAIKELVWRAA